MADNGLLVTISGAALSLLFYENACCSGDQMGFLLGDVVMFVTKNVTDSERHVESERRHIEITGVLTCPSAGVFHNNNGKLYAEALQNFVRERSKEIVGWFRFGHNIRLVHTFRDKILHKALANYFHESNANSPKEFFLACILNKSTTDKMGTHKFRHVLLRYEDGTYRPIPMRINNLGDDAARHDGSDYMPTPVARLSHEPDVFTKFVRALNINRHQKSGSELVTMIQKAAEQHLKSLIPRVCESDREIFEMERQVCELRSKLVSKVMRPDSLSVDNQQVNESNNHRLSMLAEGDQGVNMEITQDTPPRTSKVYEDLCTDKDLLYSKTKGTVKLHSVINTNRSPNDSAQRAPSSPLSYSSATRQSSESEDLFSPSDC